MRLPLLLLASTLGIATIGNADTTGSAHVERDAEPTCVDTTATRGWAAVLAAVAVLEHGTRQEKRALFVHDARGIGGPFNNHWPDPDCAAGAVEGMIDRLRFWASSETDTWLLDLAAGNIAFWGYDAAFPLFRDLSRHRAPSLRARAIQQAVEMKGDPSLALLLDMWPVEREPWVMALLLEAIDDLTHPEADGRTPPFDRCVELIRHDDPELSAAAMACAAWNDLPGTQAALVNVVVEGLAEPARRALDALANVQELSADSGSRLEALRTSEFNPGLRQDLFRILTAFDPEGSLTWARGVLDGHASDWALEALAPIGTSDDPGDRERLVKVAFDGPPELRAKAIGLAARDLTIPEVPEILARGLTSSAAVQVRSAAVEAIIWAHRPHPDTTHEELASGTARFVPEDAIQAVMPLFGRVGRTDPDPKIRERVRDFQENGPLVILRRLASSVIRDPTFFRVAELGLEGTLRCFGAPASERPSDDPLRAAKGSMVVGQRRFDDGGSVWREVLIKRSSCWLPEARLERVDFAAYQASVFDLPPPLEFDLAHAETRTAVFLGLEESGLLARFDPGREVTGVALLLDGAGREGLEALLQAAQIEGPLGRALEPHDAGLRARLAALESAGDR